jgi:hypothetical protein
LAEIDAAAVARSERLASTLMERVESSEAGRDTVVEHLRRKVIEDEQDLAGAIEHVADLCAVIAERLEAQRLEQRQVGELLSALTLQLAASTSSAAPSRVIGGSFYSSESPPDDDAFIEIGESRNDALTAADDADPEPWSDADEHDAVGTGIRSRQGWRST